MKIPILNSKSHHFVLAILLTSAFILYPLPCFSSSGQDSTTCSPSGKRPTIGLTLSGGAAKGLAHIGVLKVLEEEGIYVDLITGNSMGALMGALYAMGYTPEEMEKIALETDWMDLFGEKIDRQYISIENKERIDRYAVRMKIEGFSIKPFPGILSGRKIHSLLSRLSWPANFYEDFKDLPRPFLCIATDIETGEAVVLTKGSLADAARASMAIPGAFAPFEIDGRLLVDGMLVRNFPGEDAIEMGAEILIGSDVGSEPMKLVNIRSLFDILNQSLVLAHLAERRKQLAISDILILPDVEEFGTLSFGNAEKIIKRGEEAAREQIEAIRALADSLKAWENPPPPPPVDLERPMHICGIRVTGSQSGQNESIKDFLCIDTPCDVTAGKLAKEIDRLYGLGGFELITYQFDKTQGCNILEVKVKEETENLLYAGFHYDTESRTAVLLNMSFKRFLSGYSDLEIDLLMSDRVRFTTQYDLQGGTKNRIALRYYLDFISDHIDTYNRDHLVERFDLYDLRVGLFTEYAFSKYFFWDAGLIGEWSQTSPNITPPEFENEWTRLIMLAADIRLDNLNRGWFPEKGIQLKLRTEFADFEDFNSDLFSRFTGNLLTRLPVTSHFSLGTRLMFGSAKGEGIPIHYRYYLGGFHSPVTFHGRRNVNFFGYKRQELSGEHAFIAGIDLQFKINSILYLILHGNAGNAVDGWDDLFEEEFFAYGGGLTVGIATPMGPVETSIAHSDWHDFSMFFSAGYRF